MASLQIDATLSSAADVTRTFIKANPMVSPADAVDFLLGIYDTLESLRSLNGTAEDAQRTRVPAIPVKDSIAADGSVIYCLVDGKPLQMLKRYIKRFGMTPETYRDAFGLPADYPMTAPAYSARKAMEAERVGLGSEQNKAGVNLNRRVQARKLVAA